MYTLLAKNLRFHSNANTSQFDANQNMDNFKKLCVKYVAILLED